MTGQPNFELIDFHAFKTASSDATRIAGEDDAVNATCQVSLTRVPSDVSLPSRVIVTGTLTVEDADGSLYRMSAGGLFGVFGDLEDDDEALRVFAEGPGGYLVYDYMSRQIRLLAAIHESTLIWNQPDVELDRDIRDLRSVRSE